MSSMFLFNLIFIYYFFLQIQINSSNCETHWLVTEDGLRVQALADSLFNMAQSHDFVQFFKQDERVRRSEDAKSRLTNQKSIINHHEQKDDPQIENRLMTTDEDCIIAGKPLIQQDLFVSTVLPMQNFGVEWPNVVAQLKNVPFPSEREADSPYCAKFFDLPFSMSAFEHLEGVSNRDNLSTAPEPSVASLAFPEWSNTIEFGHAVTAGLTMEPNSWVMYTLASYFWRTVGDSNQAVDCLRRALHFAPKTSIVVPMLSLANVLHQTSRSKEAAVVLEAALTYNDTISDLYFTLGHALAVTLKYDASVEAFQTCLIIDSDYPLANIHRAAVECHKKLENALETQHQNLQKTLTELQSYQVRLKNFQKLHDDMIHHVVDPATKQDMTLIYDHFVYGPLDGLECNWTVNQEGRYLDCQITDYHAYKALKLSRFEKSGGVNPSPKVSSTIRASSTTSTSKTAKSSPIIRQTTTKNGRPVDFDKEKEYLANLEKNRGLNSTADPWDPKKYPLKNVLELYPQDSLPHLNENWPDPAECGEILVVPTVHSVPHLFLSPDNKGFNLTRLFAKGLNLEGTEAEHPLPWYPPFCTGIAMKLSSVHLSCCDHLLGVQRAKNRDKEHLLPEPELKQILLNIAAVSSQSEAEVGQRIFTLWNFDIGPKWIVYNLAALYWRLIGVVSESMACLRLALNENDQQKFSDVGLFQLSYLAFSAGNRLDDAIALLHQAAAVDNDEPMTHYMLAFYYFLKENYNSSAVHLKTTLDLEPEYADAVDLLKVVRCKIRSKKFEESKIKIEKPPLRQITERDSVPKFFCLKENGREHCYLEERMLPGATREDSETFCPIVGTFQCTKTLPFSSTFVHAKLSKKSVDADDRTGESTLLKKIDSSGPSAVPIPTDFEPELSLVDASLQPSSSIPPHEEVPELEEDLDSKAANRINEIIDDEDAQEDEDDPSADVEEKSADRKLSVFDQLLETIKTEVERKERIVKILPPDQATKNSPLLDVDNTEPEILPVPSADQVRSASSFVSLPTSAAECAIWKNRVKPDQATSTWLSITAKGINIKNYLDFNTPPPEKLVEPLCPINQPFSMWTMDHLQGFVNKNNLTQYKPERGLKDALQNLGGNKKESVDSMASRIAVALKSLKTKYFVEDGSIVVENDAAWVLSTLAALYWRVRGNSSMAIDCLRYSVAIAPVNMKDLALVSLANIYHQSGYFHSALITAGAALRNSPRFVVVHFTLANIYASIGDIERATAFLYSTLSLQNNFEPAKDRIRALYCTSGFVPQPAVRTQQPANQGGNVP